MRSLCILTLATALFGCASVQEPGMTQTSVTSPINWSQDYSRFLDAQAVNRTEAGYAEGKNGAVTVAYNGLAARAGLAALEGGGNAVDAAMTTAMAQIALTGGSPISYFGIMSLVYYDAETGEVHTMNAEWNSVKGELDPLSIPGLTDFSTEEGLLGRGVEPSGRTAMVGGFMKGVEAAHARFGKLPFKELFEPSIYIAEQGFPITKELADQIEKRREDLARLPATKAIFTDENGEFLGEGDILRQPQLAKTLRAVAKNGSDYMYDGPWGQKLVAAVQADGGFMTMDDLRSYEVEWSEPIKGDLGNGFEVYTNPAPNFGGVALIEAQNLARVSGLAKGAHWTRSGEALRKAIDISNMAMVPYLPEEARKQAFPGIDFSPSARVTMDHARRVWALMEQGATGIPFEASAPKHSDDVVVIDSEGNIAAITHSINTVYWGRTAIFVDGISISDAAAIQQAVVAKAGPGNRVPAPTETGVVFKDGKPVLGFASMGSGLHQRTLLGLLNFTHFGMDVREAINSPDFFFPKIDSKTGKATVYVPEGRFDKKVLEEMGYAYREIPNEIARLEGEGKWVAISRDPETGLLKAASHNRNNSAAVAY